MTGPIGGFFGLASAGAGDLVAHWGAEAAPGWVNATSALAALVAHLRPGAVWLPGYICAELVAAAGPCPLRFFPLGADMAPDGAALEGRLAPGDLVLAANMFGRAPGAAWRAFVTAHPQVTFVEDCAQALDTGGPAWGDWRLYSPRKLVGVPEGGILVPVSGRAEGQADGLGPKEPADAHGYARRLAPMAARAQAPETPGQWHALHRAAEASQAVSDQAMSDAAWRLLATLEPAPMIAARKRNFAALARVLGDHAALPETDPAFAPMGFPVRVAAEARAQVLAHLHGAGVFAAVHWRDIPAPPDFAADHARAASLITLPCDHRYGDAQMERVAETFLAACK